MPIFSLPEARIWSFLHVPRRHVSRALKASSRESSLRHFIPPESLTSEKERASWRRRKRRSIPARNTSFLDGVAITSRKLESSFFLPPSRPYPHNLGGCRPRSSKVNLIQKRRDLVSGFSHSVSPFLAFPGANCDGGARECRKHSRPTREVPISLAVPRFVVEICPYLLHSSAARACAAETYCRYSSRSVQKLCSPHIHERKILNQRLRHLLENDATARIRECSIA